jgi:hypothetical protein
MSNESQLQKEIEEWKQLAVDALSGDETLVNRAIIKLYLGESLLELESLRRVLLLCEGKPGVETLESVIKRIKKFLPEQNP